MTSVCREFLATVGIILAAAALCFADEKSDPIVKFTTGQVRGRVKWLEDSGHSTAQFLGIPYAEPPVGELRFAAPKPAKPWSDVKDATTHAARCPQNALPFPMNITIGTTNEDCLFLNVYRPSNAGAKKPLPVLVYIHGGGFYSGSGNEYNGTALSAFMEVIVVTINYRLGFLGFFNIPGSELKGNYGLLDQVLALKWVQKNIASFGGDPQKVTIFGQSAGSASVSFHLLSPLSEGLFQRAIMQSGVATSPLASYTSKDPEYGSSTLVKLACKVPNDELLSCLRKVDYSEFVTFSKRLTPLILGRKLPLPTVDGHFLPADPRELVKQGKLHNVPAIIGFNKDEGSIVPLVAFGHLRDRDIDKEFFDEMVRENLFTTNGEPETVKKMIIYKYTNHTNATSQSSLQGQWKNLIGDSWAFAPSVAFANALSKTGAATFLYQFSHRTILSIYPIALGVNQMDEVPYIFGSPWEPLRTLPVAFAYADAERGLSTVMMTWWRTFADLSDPNPVDAKHAPVKWPQYTSDESKYMSIELKSQVKSDFLPDRMAFWIDLVPEVKRLSSCSCDSKASEDEAKPSVDDAKASEDDAKASEDDDKASEDEAKAPKEEL